MKIIMKSKVSIPFIVAMAGYVLAIIGVFLPFLTAKSEGRVLLELAGMADVTIFKMISIAGSEAIGLVRNLIIYGIAAIGAIVNTILGKSKASITCTVVMFIMNIFININMSGGEDIYNRSVGCVFMWIGCIAAVVGTVWAIFYSRNNASNNINNNYTFNSSVPTPTNGGDSGVPTPTPAMNDITVPNAQDIAANGVNDVNEQNVQNTVDFNK